MNNLPEYPIELLAPARDRQSGELAIDCGADAVYIGPERFGAREQVSNSMKDIAQLCDYAHRFWARVYITINTLLFDHEISKAVSLIQELYDRGADAIIIQDVGLLECDLPPIPLIASTQMHNHSIERVRFLEHVGFTRIILARELGLEHIREIRRNTRVELECFVHGAICVGYSGQCYLSYSLGGRSGNRGQCAQPCRKSYTLKDAMGKVVAQDRHLLSLKDMNFSEHLEHLLDAGVTSFKIEGRLKDTSYIINVVSHYRQQLDAQIRQKKRQRSSSGASRINFKPNLDKTFNRGYTDYFLNSREKMAAMDTPKSTGEPLGKIKHMEKQCFILEKSQNFHAGDGVCFFNAKKQLQGTNINKVVDQRVYPDKMAGLDKGVFLYRNHDHEFLRALEKSRPLRKISLTFTWQAVEDGFDLTAQDEDGIAVSVHLPCEKHIAEKQELALVQIRKQLGKLGDTEFASDRIIIETDSCFFLPISLLNAVRRHVIEQIRLERQRRFSRRYAKISANSYPYPETELDFRGNVLNQKARNFYLRHGVVDLESAAESGLNMTGKIVMTGKYCIRYELGFCGSQLSYKKFQEPLYLIDEEQNRFKLVFNCKDCNMNVILVQKGNIHN